MPRSRGLSRRSALGGDSPEHQTLRAARPPATGRERALGRLGCCVDRPPATQSAMARPRRTRIWGFWRRSLAHRQEHQPVTRTVLSRRRRRGRRVGEGAIGSHQRLAQCPTAIRRSEVAPPPTSVPELPAGRSQRPRLTSPARPWSGVSRSSLGSRWTHGAHERSRRSAGPQPLAACPDPHQTRPASPRPRREIRILVAGTLGRDGRDRAPTPPLPTGDRSPPLEGPLREAGPIQYSSSQPAALVVDSPVAARAWRLDGKGDRTALDLGLEQSPLPNKAPSLALSLDRKVWPTTLTSTQRPFLGPN